MNVTILKNKHIKIFIGCLVSSIAFSYFHLSINPQYLDIFILFFIYLFTLIETSLWIWRRFVVHKLNKTVENKTTLTILIFVLFYLTTFLIAIVIYLIEIYVWWKIKGFDMSNFISHLINTEMLPVLVVNNFLLLFGSVVLLFHQWLTIIKQKQKEKEEKYIYQYQTLKNQLNPHFLFNSLNVLSSIVKTEPELSENFVYKLASIYRYVLSSTQTDMIDLKEEIKFAQEYFYLNKIRDEEKINLEIDVDFSQAFKIIPISLQLLIENCLKHNSATREKPLFVNIKQYSNYIKVSNNLQKKNSLSKSSKLGLQNLNERLILLTGKELVIEKTKTEFAVTIPIMRV